MTDAIVKALLDIANELTASNKIASNSIQLVEYNFVNSKTIMFSFRGIVMKSGYNLGVDNLTAIVKDFESEENRALAVLQRALESGAIGVYGSKQEKPYFSLLRNNLCAELLGYLYLSEKPTQEEMTKIKYILNGYVK